MLPEERNKIGVVICSAFLKDDPDRSYRFRISATEIEKNTEESLGYLLKTRLEEAQDRLAAMSTQIAKTIAR